MSASIRRVRCVSCCLTTHLSRRRPQVTETEKAVADEARCPRCGGFGWSRRHQASCVPDKAEKATASTTTDRAALIAEIREQITATDDDEILCNSAGDERNRPRPHRTSVERCCRSHLLCLLLLNPPRHGGAEGAR